MYVYKLLSNTLEYLKLEALSSPLNAFDAHAGKTALREVAVAFAGCNETRMDMYLTQSPVTCVATASYAWVDFKETPDFTTVRRGRAAHRARLHARQDRHRRDPRHHSAHAHLDGGAGQRRHLREAGHM